MKGDFRRALPVHNLGVSLAVSACPAAALAQQQGCLPYKLVMALQA